MGQACFRTVAFFGRAQRTSLRDGGIVRRHALEGLETVLEPVFLSE